MLRTLSLTTLLLTVTLAGCIGGNDTDGTGTFTLAVVDDAESDVSFTFEGVWGAHNETGSFARLVDANSTWDVAGSGVTVDANGAAPAGTYTGLRVAFKAIQEDGTEVHMTTNGFDMALPFQVMDGEETRVELAFSWPDTFFDAQQGRAFVPALKAVTVTEAGTPTVELGSKDILLGDTKPPVARMRVFDPTGLQVFESDFIAESLLEPVVANPGNVTFAASASEVLHPGAEMASYEWHFDDGTVLEGVTVEHLFDEGRNHTVRLVVTDTEGESDTQTLTIAVKPPLVAHDFPVNGIVSGTFGSQAGLSACGTQPDEASGVTYMDFPFELDPFALPDGEPALGFARLETLVEVTGNENAETSIGARTTDGEGDQVHGAGNANFPGYGGEHYATEYPAGATAEDLPAAGTWNLRVYSCSGVNTEFAGHVAATWIFGEPGYALWINGYDDGHNHQH